uniref:Uncharacterized protein MANES_17G022300 n=1 Tax=Rhizophora mucronata TaxID=61149 RepID=A0A2P2LRV0_RHIMU
MQRRQHSGTVAQKLSKAFSPPPHKMPYQVAGSHHRTIWKKWTDKEGIFPRHHEPTKSIKQKNKSPTSNIMFHCFRGRDKSTKQC